MGQFEGCLPCLQTTQVPSPALYVVPLSIPPIVNNGYHYYSDNWALPLGHTPSHTGYIKRETWTIGGGPRVVTRTATIGWGGGSSKMLSALCLYLSHLRLL